jgi:SNF2 family DNA or RNA helicase
MPWLYDTVEFYPHQVEGVRWCAKRRSFILADDMGLGKSLQALATFTIDVVRGWGEKAIVVCPVTLRENWIDEIEKFTTYPYLVLEGTPKEREATLAEFDKIAGPKILLTNYEQAVKHFLDYNRIGFDVAIFDEAHYLKNPKSQRTKACMKILSSRSFMLTGTPLLNQVNELWALMYRCDPIGTPRYWTFVNRYCVMGGWKNKQIIGIKNKKELLDKLHDMMLRRTKKEVLKLPPVQFIPRKVALSKEQRAIYEDIKNELKIGGHLNVGGPGDPDVLNALVKFIRLKQVCGTTFSFNGKDISSKLDLAVSDAEELILGGHKIIFFTQFREILELYQSRLRAVLPSVPLYELHGDVPSANRVNVVKSWAANPEPGPISCMLQVAGVGLNMTAAQHIQFADKLFVPGLNQQAIDRAVRIGSSTTQAVQVWEYICKNTIDTRIQKILTTKKELFSNVVETSDWKRKLYQALMEEEDA